VPLLMAQFVLVLRLERLEAARLLRSLMIAAALMIGLGYPGEISNNTGVKLAFWAAGFVPFAYIVYVLWVGLNRSLFRYSDDVALAVARARMLLVGIWLVYPVAYLFPILGIDSVTGEMSRQILYSLADVIAKAGFGLFIYRIARLLTDEDPYARSLKNEYQVDLADAGRGLEAKF
jgi:bacteriorhodopsin